MPWKKCSVMDERLQFVARRRANSGSLQGLHAHFDYQTCMEKELPLMTGAISVESFWRHHGKRSGCQQMSLSFGD